MLFAGRRGASTHILPGRAGRQAGQTAGSPAGVRAGTGRLALEPPNGCTFLKVLLRVLPVGSPAPALKGGDCSALLPLAPQCLADDGSGYGVPILREPRGSHGWLSGVCVEVAQILLAL